VSRFISQFLYKGVQWELHNFGLWLMGLTISHYFTFSFFVKREACFPILCTSFGKNSKLKARQFYSDELLKKLFHLM